MLLVIVPASLVGILGTAKIWGTSPLPEPFASPTLVGLVADPADDPQADQNAKDYNSLVDYIEENTSPDEFIFSGDVRHDKIFTNDVLIYFASERHAGTRDYHMHPGSTTTRDVQQIIADLKRNEVRLIVLGDFGVPQEPNRSRESSGVTDLDDYIHDNYVIREKFGWYFVLTARQPTDSPCSSVPVRGTYGALEQAQDPTTGTSTVDRYPGKGYGMGGDSGGCFAPG